MSKLPAEIFIEKLDAAFDILTETKDINPNYIDANGNNLIHIVLLKMKERLMVLDDNSKGKEATFITRITQQQIAIIAFVINLLKKLKNQGCQFDHRNNGNKTVINQIIEIKNQIPSLDITCLEDLITFLITEYESAANTLLAGRKYVTDLTLFRGAKKERKKVMIPDSWSTSLEETASAALAEEKQRDISLTLHQQLAAYETHLKNLSFAKEATNIVIATLSFIVSSKPHRKEGDHDRQLITVPIYQPGIAVEPNSCHGTHAEAALTTFLIRDMHSNPPQLIKELCEKYNQQKGVKVYDIILDIHSTNEVCDGCESLLRKLQTQSELFIAPLASQLQNNGFKVSQKRKRQPLTLTIRADGLDHYPKSSSDPDRHVIKPCFKSDMTPNQSDIRKHEPGVLFHLPPKKTTVNGLYFSSRFFSLEPEAQNKAMHEAYKAKKERASLPTEDSRAASAEPKQAIKASSTSSDTPSTAEPSLKKQKTTEATAASSSSSSSSSVDVVTTLPHRLFTAFVNSGGNAKQELMTDKLKQLIQLNQEQLDKILKI